VSPLLEIRGLSVSHARGARRFLAVEELDLVLAAGEVLAVVGESGCGKSTLLASIARLFADPRSRIESGSIRLAGGELVGLSEERLRLLRGSAIGFVFQDAQAALNPVLRVGAQIEEGRRSGSASTLELLARVGLPEPERVAASFPHQLSGGMRQRVMIAMALSCNPKLLIADEPTTALDVTIQAQILDLMTELKERLGMAVMLITHAMGVVAETAQRVVVMYAGRVVEEARVADLFRAPLHPYTLGLIRSIPRLDLAATQRRRRLETIAGTVPRLIDPAPGCRFAARCPSTRDECLHATPPLIEVAPGHKVACVLHRA